MNGLHAQICETQMRHGSKSFYAASRLLPQAIRQDATALYAFCRVADDAVDLAVDDVGRAAALAHLHERLDHIYAGNPLAYAEDIMLAPVIFQHRVPRGLLHALLEGFTWDAEGRQYETIDDLLDYCARVAGTVGVMMSLLMGVRDMATLRHAAALGSAMQLTNIARDVGEDAASGRLYLPKASLRREGIDPKGFLSKATHGQAITHVVQELLDSASDLYDYGKIGLLGLPGDCRFGIDSAARIYAEIGRVVRKNHFDSITRRAYVTKSRKVELIAAAWLKNFSYVSGFRRDQSVRVESSSLVSVNSVINKAARSHQFLFDSVTNDHSEHWRTGIRSVLPQQRSFYGRTVWLFELGEKLAQIDRDRRVQGSNELS